MHNDIGVLQGQTIKSIDGAKAGSGEIIFTLADGRKFRMYHPQDCCESVSVEDICGNVSDLIGVPIGLAEKVSNAEAPSDVPARTSESPEWTFYKLVTVRSAVTIRWYDGYYSTSVNFEQIDSGEAEEDPASPSAWTETHPTKTGLCWVSVRPEGRNPGPWLTLPAVFWILILPNGDVWEEGKAEPTYNVNEMPASVTQGVKYQTVDTSATPSDPWA